jgi:hypothetical protein
MQALGLLLVVFLLGLSSISILAGITSIMPKLTRDNNRALDEIRIIPLYTTSDISQEDEREKGTAKGNPTGKTTNE